MIYVDRYGAQWFVDTSSRHKKHWSVWKRELSGRLTCCSAILNGKAYRDRNRAQQILDVFASKQNWEVQVG